MTFLLPSGRRLIAVSAFLVALSGCTNPPAADAQDKVSRAAETSAPTSDIASRRATRWVEPHGRTTRSLTHPTFDRLTGRTRLTSGRGEVSAVSR